MTGEIMPRGELVGIIIGAVVLFSLISIVPILIMWHHRRRQASRAGGGVEALDQSPIEQWIEGQNAGSDVAQQSQELCPICLSSLSSTSGLLPPEPARLPHNHRKPSDSSGSTAFSRVDFDTEKGWRRDSAVVVLNRCHHVFHKACLASWFEYRRH
ncbi:Uncharacterized protein PECH_000758 [Penicillium ucsense]|uniref:RING-type domain-containing protein n=1 Tax=Penicillium ucsense TaxID=2839758 RepID=A0A8J8W308_9EURO|nr:Uncharacterized protein PECM_004756 [Penicillium ucsense]KAF7733368.1 Uncharacterized protein PECH_000758 [Penicillium ucsense]